MPKPAALVTLFLILSPCMCAQTEVTQPETIFRSNVRLVVVDAQVLNKKTGYNVDGLTPGDFRLYENGLRQQISYLSQDELPLSVVFLFDLTDSVRPVLEPLAAGALRALRHLKPEDEAAVMVYAVSTQMLQEFTADHERLADAIHRASRMESPEAAFFNEGVFQAAAYSTRAAAGRRRIIIWLTDNVPNIPSEELRYKYRRSIPPAGLHTEADAMEELFRNGISVYTLLLRSDISDREFMHNMHDPLHMIGRRLYPPGDVYRYTGQTGGQVLESWSPSRASARLADLIDRIRTRYALGYHPPAETAPGFHELKLEIAPEIRLREGKLIVNVRRGYYR